MQYTIKRNTEMNLCIIVVLYIVLPEAMGFTHSATVLKYSMRNLHHVTFHTYHRPKHIPTYHAQSFRRYDDYFDELQNASILADIFLDRSVPSSSTFTNERKSFSKLTQARPSKLDLPRKNLVRSESFTDILDSVENNIGRLFMVGAILLIAVEIMTGRSTIQEIQVLFQ